MQFKVAIALTWMVLMTACSGGTDGLSEAVSNGGVVGTGTGDGENQISGSQVDAASMKVGDSFTITDLGDDNNITLEFGSDVNADDEYLFVLSTPEQTAQTFSYAFGSEGRSSRGDRLGMKVEEEESENATQSDMHDFLRRIEDDLPAQDFVDEGFQSKSMAGRSSVEVGDTKNFRVLNSLGNIDSCETVSAEAVLVNDIFVLYVDNSVTLTADQIDTYAALEDVLTEEIAIIGEPSDVDANGRFYVLITDVVNSLGSSGNGFVTGFFNAIDLYDRSDYRCSNETEIVYLDAPDPNRSKGSVAISNEFYRTNLQPTVLPHEFQHLVSFNQHVLTRSGKAEKSAFNEALSHLFEGQIGGNFGDPGNENPSRVVQFLNAPNAKDLLSGTSLAQRGGMYLFLRFLCDQANLGNLSGVSTCEALISDLVQTDQTGIENVEAATGEDFVELFSNFSMALAINGLGLTDETRFDFDSVTLYKSWQDNRGTRWDGINVSDLSDASAQLSSNAINIISIKGSDVRSYSGKIEMQGSAGNVRAHLIRVN